MAQERDWTMNAGRSNSSEQFLTLVQVVNGIIRHSGVSLVTGQVRSVARVIVSQLAHEYNLRPASLVSEWDWTVDVDVPTKRSDSSEQYQLVVGGIEMVIRDSGYDILNDNSVRVARIIMAKLAHECGMAPSERFVRRWAIEFTHGGFLQDLEADIGGPVGMAQTFDSEDAAKAFVRKNHWVFAKGGTAKEVEVLR